MREHAGERVPLELRARVEHALRRRGGGARGGRPGAKLHRHPELVVRVAPGILALRRVSRLLEQRLHRSESALAVVGAVDLDACAIDRYGSASREPRLEAGGVVGRDRRRAASGTTLTSKPCRDGERHAAQRCGLARGVAVEREPEALRQPAELLQLLLGERRAHAGDDRLEPGLAQREHVGVALDDAGAILLRDRGARTVEPVDDPALVEQLGLARVHVLRRERVVLVQAARLEPEHPAAGVGEREEQAPLEVVVPALPRQPGGAQLLAW